MCRYELVIGSDEVALTRALRLQLAVLLIGLGSLAMHVTVRAGTDKTTGHGGAGERRRGSVAGRLLRVALEDSMGASRRRDGLSGGEQL